jgi:hypothetical protein
MEESHRFLSKKQQAHRWCFCGVEDCILSWWSLQSVARFIECGARRTSASFPFEWRVILETGDTIPWSTLHCPHGYRMLMKHYAGIVCWWSITLASRLALFAIALRCYLLVIAGQLVLLTVGIALRLWLHRLLSSTTCAVDQFLVVSFCSFVIAVFSVVLWSIWCSEILNSFSWLA